MPKKKITKNPSEEVSVNKPDLTQADRIWNEIKDLGLGIFSLPNQIVSNYYKKINVMPDKLYLVALTKATSVLPLLEAVISSKYLVEQVDRFIIITPKNSYGSL